MPPIESIFENQDLLKQIKLQVTQKQKKTRKKKKLEERKASEAEPSSTQEEQKRVSFHEAREKPVPRLQKSIKRNRRNDVSRSVTRQKSMSS